MYHKTYQEAYEKVIHIKLYISQVIYTVFITLLRGIWIFNSELNFQNIKSSLVFLGMWQWKINNDAHVIGGYKHDHTCHKLTCQIQKSWY